MKIGIDARFYGKAGPGRYVKNIVQALEEVDKKNDYTILLTKEGFSAYEPKNPKFKKVLADNKWYSFDEQTRYLITVLKQNLDLYYCPHFNIPVLLPGKIVTAIPDMIMHQYSKESATTLPKPYFLFKKIVYKFVFWWALFRSANIIVPTKSVIKEFYEAFPSISKEKYVLANEGVDPDLTREVGDPEKVLNKYGIVRPYILHIGSMYVHKNIDRIIEAFKILQDKYDYKGQLVLAGKIDKFSSQLNERVKAEGLDKDIILPAFREQSPTSDIVVSDEELNALRSKASVYVFASLKEGFSLTGLESMRFDLPCAMSRIPVHEEVYGDSVLYFDPYDSNDIAETVHRILTDEVLRADLIKKGHKQFEKYSWTNTAEITLGVFNNVLENSK